jgi:uncharacterized protein YqgV (UPF0045/DUF77 family)
MHQFTVNATLQILPIVKDRHPYEWVDEAIEIIQNSGIKYKVGSFSTELEGTYEEVMRVVNLVNDYLYSKECIEWIASIQIQIRSNEDMTGDEKTAKFT